MTISDIRLKMMQPGVIQNLARDKHALLRMPADVYWVAKRADFGWYEIQVDVTLHKAAIYLKEVLKIKFDPKKIQSQQPPLKMFFREDSGPLPLQAVTNYFHPKREGRLRIYFIDFFESTGVGIAQSNRNVVLMNGQLLLKPLTSGVSSFGDGSAAGMTLTHEIGHSLGLEHKNPLYAPLMAERLRDSGLNVSENNYYLARLYGLIYKRLEKDASSLL